MLELLIVFFFLGALVAWNIWPQPKWMENLYAKFVALINDKSNP